MKLCDVNVLLYAHREESSEHEAFAGFPDLNWSHPLRRE
jgi:predicted nucleic acid-binding protein